jgi:hypothetical protein
MLRYSIRAFQVQFGVEAQGLVDAELMFGIHMASWLPKRFVFVTPLFSPLLVTLIVSSLFLCHWQCNT